VANIFGDSSDDSDEEPLEKTITTTTAGEELDKNDGDRKLDKNDEEQEQEDKDKDDDEREDVEMEDEGVVKTKAKTKVSNSVLDEYAGEDKEEVLTVVGEGEKEERKGEPMHLIAALNEEEEEEDDKDENEKEIYLNPIVSKATNIFDVNAKKFDENTFQEEEDKTIVDEFGRSRLKAKEGNVARWTRDETTNELKSNAKFVEWSDGSKTLHLGEEVFNVMESAVSSKQGLNQYVFARHQGLMEGKAKISKRMQFRPATTDSHTHKRLRDAIEKKHGARAKGTIRFVSNVDPEKEKDASDRLFEQRAREEAQLQRKRKKMMSEDIRSRADGGDGVMRRDGGRDGRYGGGNRSIRGVANELYYDERSRREAELDAAFLEEGAEDELEENDDFIVPDDKDDEDESDENDNDKETNEEADTRRKRVLVDSDEEE